MKGMTQYSFIFLVVLFIGIFGFIVTEFNLDGADTPALNDTIELPQKNASTTQKVVTYIDNSRKLVSGLSTSNPIVQIFFLAILGVFGVYIVQKMLELIPG